MSTGLRRVLVVSHPCVLAVNQLPYAALRRHGWDPFLVVPSRWRNEYSSAVIHEVLPELTGRVSRRRIARPGRIQRHAYVGSLGRIIDEVRPEVAFVEQETTSLAAFQWGSALSRARVPFGVQAAENIDRPLPAIARAFRHRTLAAAAFAAARSPSAAELIGRLRSELAAPVVPHHVPEWPVRRVAHDSFVVGFAGRLVPAKGVDVLIDAAAGMPDTRVRLIGDGPMREELLRAARAQGVRVEAGSVPHAAMASAFADLDVLVLPSRTTVTWSEQFGRVLVEALWCGVPVIGSDSGEIPWVIEATGGGIIVPEGDPVALRGALEHLRAAPGLRKDLAQHGRARVSEQFSVTAVTATLSDALRGAIDGM